MKGANQSQNKRALCPARSTIKNWNFHYATLIVLTIVIGEGFCVRVF